MKIRRDLGKPNKAKKQVVSTQYFELSRFFGDQRS